MTGGTRARDHASQAGRELDAAVARALGHAGVGYYGPNTTPTMHTDYDLMPTQEAARQRYIEHWGHDHMVLDDDDFPELCWWKQDWGPIFVGHYSTDISDAWEVVEHMRRLGWGIHLESGRIGFSCQWFDEDGVPAEEGTGDTAQVAICRAALAAMKETP